MPANYVLLGQQTLSQSAASVTFSNIPQSGYTDLKIVVSARSARTTGGTDNLRMEINGSTANFTYRNLEGNGSTVVSDSDTTTLIGFLPQEGGSTGWTANTFASTEVYIPNAFGSTNKSISVDTTTENNATTSYANLLAKLWSQTAAISSLTFRTGSGSSFIANSTFSLYGIAAVGTTPVIAPKASGGNITTDGTYWIHTFLTTGTFTPSQGLTCDALVVAGGGGGTGIASGGGAGGPGGGAGGFRTSTGLSVSAQAYTITVGAGGAGGIGSGAVSNGTDSVFSTITSTGGGGGGNNNGASGGSGGGARYSGTAGSGNTPSTSPSQGNNGGTSVALNTNGGGGGGGASAVGGNGTGSASDSATISAGNGGAGTSNSYSGSAVTYAGGGGGGCFTGTGSTTQGTGGAGGGGAGSINANATSGTVNTGGGGGGAGRSAATAYNGGTGGSGIVIIRYTIA